MNLSRGERPVNLPVVAARAPPALSCASPRLSASATSCAGARLRHSRSGRARASGPLATRRWWPIELTSTYPPNRNLGAAYLRRRLRLQQQSPVRVGGSQPPAGYQVLRCARRRSAARGPAFRRTAAPASDPPSISEPALSPSSASLMRCPLDHDPVGRKNSNSRSFFVRQRAATFYGQPGSVAVSPIATVGRGSSYGVLERCRPEPGPSHGEHRR